MRVRSVTVAAIICMTVLAACSSSSNNGSHNTTTTTSNKSFAIATPDGQVSLSLNGQLPPNWPSSFPVPSGAKPAGSGSLVNGSTDVKIAVYSTTESAQSAYDFYKNNSSLTVASASQAGVGSAFVGTIKLGGQYDGSSVVVVGSGSSTKIVITLKSGSGSQSSSSSTANTTTTT